MSTVVIVFMVMAQSEFQWLQDNTFLKFLVGDLLALGTIDS